MIEELFCKPWTYFLLNSNWSSNTLATSCEELTQWKRPWCWEGLGAGREGDDRGWGWMASPTWWTWVWMNSGSWWWTGRPGMLWFMGSQRVGHDWVTELNWTDTSHLSRRADYSSHTLGRGHERDEARDQYWESLMSTGVSDVYQSPVYWCLIERSQ